MKRLKEAAALLSRSKPRQEDVRLLQNDWQVSSKKGSLPIPLPEVIQEFRGKIIKAAQKLQQQLLDSAERPASSAVEQSARMDTTDVVDFDDCLLYTSPSPRDRTRSRMPSSA